MKYINEKPIDVISFGGGVQTVAMVAMCAYGDLPKPDFTIMGDTGWERKGTYEYMKWFIPWAKERGINILIEKKGNLRDDIFAEGKRCAGMPLFIDTGEFEANGKPTRGIIGRKCTKEYKIEVVYKTLRESLGYKTGERMKHKVRTWIGISLDESHRMRISDVAWREFHYPFIDMRIRRGGIIEYLKDKGLPVPPKSACIGCPFRSNASWFEMKSNSPSEFEDACKFDDDMRDPNKPKSIALRKLRGKPYLHDSLTPLREANIEADQAQLFGAEMGEECSGFCGT
jgi:hypothetical protein